MWPLWLHTEPWWSGWETLQRLLLASMAHSPKGAVFHQPIYSLSSGKTNSQDIHNSSRSLSM